MGGTFCPMAERGDHEFVTEVGDVWSRCRLCNHRIVNIFKGVDDEKKQKRNEEKTQQQEKEVK